MYLVVIHGWREESAQLAQAVAAGVGITAYEARQRLIGGGPAVVASYADRQMAQSLAVTLKQSGVPSFVVDVAELRSGAGFFFVRRFELGERVLRIEALDGQSAQIAYCEIKLLLQGTRIAGQTEVKTVTERKFSVGRTLLAGGIPLTKKVTHEEEVSTEERTKVLYLSAGDRPQVVFSQSGMTYDGLGGAMKMSQELNFNYLISELRRLSPGAVYDDRLLNRVAQVRILGPAQSPEPNVDLAARILARSIAPPSSTPDGGDTDAA